MLEVGIKGSASFLVEESKTAKVVGSGNVELLSSPMMIALMEKAAWTSVAPYLPEGAGTVGILLEVRHVKPTPVGMRVSAESELIEIKGKRLVFRITASDEQGLIGEGIHGRAMVDEVSFQEKAQGK
jgi:predicted thioesterase